MTEPADHALAQAVKPLVDAMGGELLAPADAREDDVVRTYVASWDDSQAASQEMRELRRLALDLRPTSAR